MLNDSILGPLIWNTFASNSEAHSSSEGGKQVEDIRKELCSKAEKSKPYLKSKKGWSMAGANIREITISPTGEEIHLWIDGVASIPYVNVHLRLTGVQDYQILRVQPGPFIKEDTKATHLHEKLRAGKEFRQWTITEDYYEYYENGMYSLLIISKSKEVCCIQVDCLNMEAEEKEEVSREQGDI